MTERQKRTKEFNAKNYDRIELIVPKGQKEELKFHSEAMNETLNAFIKRAIQRQLEEDNKSNN